MKDTENKKLFHIPWKVMPKIFGHNCYSDMLKHYSYLSLNSNFTPPFLDISKVREYGITKYSDPDNWKKVNPQDYCDAFLRHCEAHLQDGLSIDPESGLRHLSHMLCNLMFLALFETGDAE
jgi:hypothetical protein